uniref:arylamine N-acetyltransferase family protein n=1 Tax=Altererythrobacter segetis TaxID=1104773 RepID=UPI00140838A8|nr:arylamine N-acetyltransferase [Altererythrobacter segetis]
MNDGELARYLERIGHAWNVRPDLGTLRSVHRAHVTAIPFEALDVQLGEVPSLEPDAIFEKLVERRRGGWCYEMNGLLGAALQAIGFDVTRLSCGVMRQDGGEERMGTHLALMVDCDGRWLCDAGFGGSLLEPLPLAADAREHAPYTVSLEQTEDGYWRFTERAETPFSYDFRAEPADEALLTAKRDWQATHPMSNFTLNSVAMKRHHDSQLILRGRVLTERGPGGTTTHTVADADEFVETLATRFGIDEPRAREVWPRILARHAELFEAAA